MYRLNPRATKDRTGVNIDLTLPSTSTNEDEWIETQRIGEWDMGKQSFHIIGNLIEPLSARYLGDYIPTVRIESIHKKRPYVIECVQLHSWRSVQPIAIISSYIRMGLSVGI